MKHDYNHIVFLVKDLAGNQYYYFDSPFEVDQEWQSITFWAICVSPSDVLYLMDGSQEWHEVQPNAYFLPQLLNKMLLINNQHQKKSA